jgi:ADP-ribosylation factor GTPase-activating protein 2/3
MMGVHITFVRSTALDKWNGDQLMFMMAGGNEKAAGFFKSKGWREDNSSSQRTTKYTSTPAVQYKKKLAELVLKNKAQYMEAIYGEQASPVVKPAASPTGGMDGLDSLLNDMKKETSKTSKFERHIKKAEAKPTRTVIRKNPVKKSGLSLKGKSGGAKKKGLLSLSSSKRSAPSGRSLTSIASKSSSANQQTDALDAAFASLSSEPFAEKQSSSYSHSSASASLTSAPTPATHTSSSSYPDASSTSYSSSGRGNSNVQEDVNAGDISAARYKNATSISSDQMFSRNDYADDPEDQSRFQQFSNANAISSDAFFGREEEEEMYAEEPALDLGALKDTASKFWESLTQS